MRTYTAKECRCWRKYPNTAHKKQNGQWKCIDCYELVSEGTWRTKTVCRLKEDDQNVEKP